MWIIPKNLDVSVSAQDMQDSNLDLNELSQICEQSLMWRGKHTRWQTWLQRLKNVNWMRLLSGRMLKLSLHESFETKYTASLAVIRASHFHKLGKGRGHQTQDTFGRLYANISQQLDLFSVSSKMYRGTLAWDSNRFTQTYELWVTQLRQDCLQRQKSVLHTKENDCSSWPTASTADAEGGHFGNQVEYNGKSFSKVNLNGTRRDAVEMNNWATPRTCDYKGSQRKDESKWSLTEQTRNWPTPAATDHKGSGQTGTGRDRLDYAAERGLTKHNGRPDRDKNNTNGNSRGQLNPAWVEQLMGLEAGWTNFDSWVTESCQTRQKKQLSVY